MWLGAPASDSAGLELPLLTQSPALWWTVESDGMGLHSHFTRVYTPAFHGKKEAFGQLKESITHLNLMLCESIEKKNPPFHITLNSISGIVVSVYCANLLLKCT